MPGSVTRPAISQLDAAPVLTDPKLARSSARAREFLDEGSAYGRNQSLSFGAPVTF